MSQKHFPGHQLISRFTSQEPLGHQCIMTPLLSHLPHPPTQKQIPLQAQHLILFGIDLSRPPRHGHPRERLPHVSSLRHDAIVSNGIGQNPFHVGKLVRGVEVRDQVCKGRKHVQLGLGTNMDGRALQEAHLSSHWRRRQGWGK